MQYQIFYTKRAERDLAKLDSQIKKRLDKAIKRMSNNPHIYSEHLTDTRLGMYRFRVGDYRVIFDIDKNNIVILRIGHRKKIYRV